MKETDQILKSRDDKEPIVFSKSAGDTNESNMFVLNSNSECSWIKKDEPFGPAKLRPRIEPWLTALFQSEHFSLLLGSGISQAIHSLATESLLPGMSKISFSVLNDVISKEAAKSAKATGREEGNIEDQIRVANELIRGLEILSESDAKAKKNAATLTTEINVGLKNFADWVLKGENGLITAEEQKRTTAFNYLVSFIMSFASRTGTRERLQVFTTNYDRFFEAGAELAGLHLLDRFVGSIAPIFRSSRLDVDLHYNPPGIRGEPRYLEGVAKFTKLHGSLDWIDCKHSIRRFGLPFGAKHVEPFLDAPGMSDAKPMNLMIYPNSAKDRETASYPYVELFRDFAAAICRPNSTLITFGFSLGDEHITRVIEDMLTIPSTHLVIISRSDPLGRIMETYSRLGRHAQITLLIGDHLGDFKSLVDNYLPKPAIDKTTFRMAELLKSRWGTSRSDSSEKKGIDETTSGEIS